MILIWLLSADFVSNFKTEQKELYAEIYQEGKKMKYYLVQPVWHVSPRVSKVLCSSWEELKGR